MGIEFVTVIFLIFVIRTFTYTYIIKMTNNHVKAIGQSQRTEQNLSYAVSIYTDAVNAVDGLINAAELPENEQNRDRILEGACRIGGELLKLNRLCPDDK